MTKKTSESKVCYSELSQCHSELISESLNDLPKTLKRVQGDVAVIFRDRFRITNKAFTIVELLIVIVIIGILATITIVAYNGITRKARIATLQSDLTSAAKQLAIANATDGSYPASPSGTNPPIILKSSPGNLYTYHTDGSYGSYCLQVSNSSDSYYITDRVQTPQVGYCNGVDGGLVINPCISGFVPVKGNINLGTSDFCVMKYEAKQAPGDVTKPISMPSGLPWTNISQANAITYSKNACATCHLITETEWMTIAADTMSMADNWSEGAVGSGFMYQGAMSGASSRAASSDDSDGMFGLSGSGNVVNSDSRRTLLLSNGFTIWDINGNVRELTSASVSCSATPETHTYGGYVTWRNWRLGPDSSFWRTFPNASLYMMTNWGIDTSYLSDSNSTSIGVGGIWADYTLSGTCIYARGGSFGMHFWGVGASALTIDTQTSLLNTNVGFRVAYSL